MENEARLLEDAGGEGWMSREVTSALTVEERHYGCTCVYEASTVCYKVVDVCEIEGEVGP